MRKIIYSIAFICVFLLPTEIKAQDDIDEDVSQAKELIALNQSVKNLEEWISREEDRLLKLKKEWYRICVDYLNGNNFKIEEFDDLIRQTDRDIDGAALYDELCRAREIFVSGDKYVPNDIPEPTKERMSGKSNKKEPKSPPKEKSTKKKEVKAPEEKDKDESSKLKEETQVPSEPTPNPKEDKPIESDPNKDKPGEEKPIVETTPTIKEDPVVNPVPNSKKVSETPKVKKEKDKGELGEGESKKNKNKDGN